MEKLRSKPLLARLREPRPLLWDGGVGTALIKRGLDLQRESPEDWLLSHPPEVAAVHADFAAAGADVVQTNTFGLLRRMVAAETAPAQAALSNWQSLARTAVDLAAQGAQSRSGEPAAVVVSLGPCGWQTGSSTSALLSARRLAKLGEELAAFFSTQAVQGLHLETCCDPVELRALLKGIRAGAPDLPLLVSLTLSLGQSGLETPLGVPLLRMLQELEANPPEVVGINCSLPARRMRKAVVALSKWVEKRARSGAAPLAILAQPQVDQPAPDCKRKRADETPEQFARALLDLLDAKPAGRDFGDSEKDEFFDPAEPTAWEGRADAVGGCCGCSAVHIAAARAAIDGAF